MSATNPPPMAASAPPGTSGGAVSIPSCQRAEPYSASQLARMTAEIPMTAKMAGPNMMHLSRLRIPTAQFGKSISISATGMFSKSRT